MFKKKVTLFQVYQIFLYLSSFFIFIFSKSYPSASLSFFTFFIWLCLLFFADLIAIQFSFGKLVFNFSFAGTIYWAFFFLFGLHATLFLILIEKTLYYLWKKRPFQNSFQTASATFLSLYIPTILFNFNLSLTHNLFQTIGHITSFTIFASLVEILTLLLECSFRQNLSFLQLLNLEVRKFWFIDLIQIVFYSLFAILIILLWQSYPWAIPLLFIPFYGLKLVMEENQRIQKEIEKSLHVMNELLEAKDDYTERHTSRVSQYAVIIAKHYGLNQEQIETVAKVGKLHDIGKILVPDNVLRKADKLSKHEFEQIKRHVEYDFTPLIPQHFPIAQWLHLARMHHERYDGKGYPFGLKGDEIPIEARIVAVADAWDAMTSRRVYRANLSEEQALQILKDNAGTQWDPRVVEAFFKAYGAGEIQAISAQYKAWLKEQEWDALAKLQQFLSFAKEL
jgi:hypothetical protein